MATRIGKLNVKVTAETKQFRTGMKNASDQTTRFARVAKAASVAMNVLKVAVLAAAAAIAVIGRIMYKGITAAADWADALGKSSDKLGLTVNELAAFQQAAGLAGVSIEQLDTALVKMQDNVAEAFRKNGPAREALEQLGLSPSTLRGMTGGQRFAEIANAISKVADQGQRVNIAMDLFGRQGAQMLVLMQNGADELIKAQERVRDIYGTLDRAQIKQIEDAHDALTILREHLRGVFYQLATQLAPIVTVLSEILTSQSKGSISDITSILKDFSNALVNINAWFAKLAQWMNEAINSIIMLVEIGLLLARKMWKYIGDTFNTAATSAGSALSTVTNNPGFTQLGAYVGGKGKSVSDWFADKDLQIAKMLKDYREGGYGFGTDNRAEMWKTTYEMLLGANDTFWDKVSKAIKKAQDSVNAMDEKRKAQDAIEEANAKKREYITKTYIDPLMKMKDVLKYAFGRQETSAKWAEWLIGKVFKERSDMNQPDDTRRNLTFRQEVLSRISADSNRRNPQKNDQKRAADILEKYLPDISKNTAARLVATAG